MANSYYYPRNTSRYIVEDKEPGIKYAEVHSTSASLEFEESDVVWQSAAPTKANGTNKRSTPVNVPDWSKIIRKEQQKSRRMSNEECCYYIDEDGDDDEKGGFKRTPPHEYVAKRMASAGSFSVHEGVGRTLKGRDLSTLRNAIWAKTGFLD